MSVLLRLYGFLAYTYRVGTLPTRAPATEAAGTALTAVPLGERSELDVVVRLIPPELQQEGPTRRSALNLSLVLDRSGSMSGPSIQLAREAACNLVAQLRPCDRVSVVAFDNQVECLLPSTPARDLPGIQRIVRGIETRGTTALFDGWLEGATQVSQHLDPQGVNRVILLTDGLANVGETRPEVLAARAGELVTRGVSTTTMGVGNDYNEELLNAMAQRGDGNFFHLDGPAQFETFFALELEGLSRLVGRRVSLGLRPASADVKVRVCNTLERTSTGRFMLSNMLSGVPTEVVATVTLEGPSTEQEMPILRVRLAWDPLQGPRQILRQELALPAVSRTRLVEFPTDPQVFQAATLIEIARLKRQASESLRRGDELNAQSSLDQARDLAERIPPSPTRDTELEDLEHIRRYCAEGDSRSAQKAAYYQQDLRHRGRTDYQSGRQTRRRYDD